MAMDELARAGDRGGARAAACASTPRTTRRSTSTGWRTSGPWCISRQLWWGHQLPVWYRDLETYVGTEPPRGEGWDRDPDVLDTWFSSALWPFATLGWPDETPRAARPSIPPTRCRPRRDIIFLWVARMIMMGLEFTGEIPFSDVYVHSIIQAPDGRRMSKSLGTGDRPDRPDRGRPAAAGVRRGQPGRPGSSRPTAPTRVRWGLLAMSSRPGRALRRGQGRPGPAADQQALERRPADPARRRRRRPAPRRRAERRRGPLDPLAAGAAPGREVAQRIERVRLLARGAGGSTTSSTASCATGTWSWSSRGCAPASPSWRRTLLHVLTETLALAHPLIPFETEEIYSHIPGAEGLLAARVVERRPAAGDRRRGRGGGRAGDRRGPGAARAGATPPRCEAGRDAAGAAGRRRLRGDRRAPRPAGSARRSTATAAERRAGGVGARSPAARSRSCQPTSVDLEAVRRKRRGAARQAQRRDRARREEARQPGLRRQGAAAGGRGRARQARAPARGAGGAVSASWRAPAALDDRRTGGRALPALAGAVRDAVRAGPHAPADDRARTIPSAGFDSIHVVGTNGKSSTARMIAAILAHHGLRTGAYLSPHLVSFGERIRIDDRDLEPAALRRRGRPGGPGGRAGRPLAGRATTA